jgi:phosphoribosyl-AMP cyclohydrolase
MIELNFDKLDGLIPVIVQDYITNEILMLAFVNKEAWQKSITTGKAHYYSRTRQKIWMKGEDSGNVQIIKEILIDCDEDTVIFKVEQVGNAACHTGYNTCFYRKVVDDELQVVGKKIFEPAEVYGKK